MQNMVESMNSFIKNQSENPWDAAIFGDIYHLSNDARGKFGEQIISSLLHILDWEIQNDVSDETIRADGHYDIKANNLRLEVKTACFTVITDTFELVSFFFFMLFLEPKLNSSIPFSSSIKILFLF